MKTKNCYFLLLLLIPLSSFGQADVETFRTHFGQTDMEKFRTQPNSGTISIDLKSRDIKGSSYINEVFSPTTFSNSENIYLLRYNAYQDEMEFEKDTKLYYLTRSFNYTITFTENNKIYQVYTFEEDTKLKDGFFVVLTIGDEISLLLKEKIKFFKEVKPQSGYDKYKSPELKRVEDKLYVGSKNNMANELPRRKKELLKLFYSKSDTIENYVKINKLSFKNTEDLIKIFSYYNSLN